MATSSGHNSAFRPGMDEWMTQKGTPAEVSARAEMFSEEITAPHICATTQCCACFNIWTYAFAGTTGYNDVPSPNFARSLCPMNIIFVYYCCNLPVFQSVYLQGFRVRERNYDFVLLLSLHCGTWDMYSVAVPYFCIGYP